MRLAALLLIALWAAAPKFASAETAEDSSLAHELAEEQAHHDTHAAPEHHDLSFSSLLKNREFQGTVFNFLVLVGLLTWVIRKKANPAMAARRAEVEKELAEAQQLRAEAERRHAEVASRLEKLDQEMAQIRAEMVKAGEAERDRIVSQAEEKAARMRKDANFLIEQQIKQLRKDLTREAANAVVLAAQELLKERATEADQEQLAELYLKRLDQVVEEPS
jgi:F-type H+-transporting ATPase subunit b